MMSNYTDLFRGNHDIAKCVLEYPWIRDAAKKIGSDVCEVAYNEPLSIGGNFIPERPIIAELCYRAGIRGEVALRPWFYDKKDECSFLVPSGKQLFLVQSTVMSAARAMRNKDWGVGNIQQVIDRLPSGLLPVQVGTSDDAPLSGVEDLRGKTNLQELTALMRRARLFLGMEGFLMHLARAVDTRSVVVYGGRTHPTSTGYRCNENLYTNLPCSPCWQSERCAHERACLSRIQVADVLEAIERLMARPEVTLETDLYDLDAA